mmetsp:Transcript_2291/g.3508  ORF Transcript_2291/g.3508 Transcript_2291/m.3508 type:complete len:391 (-) Transcript_2291:125-1297(-)
MQLLMRLIRLIVALKWKEVKHILKRKMKTVHEQMHQLQNDVSILCIACSHNAPADILKDLITLDPSSAFVADDHGMLPLHIACLVGAPSESIEVLLDVNKGASAVGCVDGFRRTPLHYSAQFIIEPDITSDAFTTSIESLSKGTETEGSSVFGSILASSRASRRVNKAKTIVNATANSISNSNANFSANKSTSDMSLVSISIDKFQNCLYTIHLLLSACPEAIHIADKEGRTPIDILQDCIASNVNKSKYERADISCKMLREKAMSLYIKEKQAWETLRVSFHSTQSSSNSSVISATSGFTNLSKLEIDGTSLNQMDLLSDDGSGNGNDNRNRNTIRNDNRIGQNKTCPVTRNGQGKPSPENKKCNRKGLNKKSPENKKDPRYSIFRRGP